MADAKDVSRRGKVEITIGNISFSGEGDQDWLDQQVSKLIEAARHGGVGTSGAAAAASDRSGSAAADTGSLPSLASYIKAKGADSNQAQRFLATAGWLNRRGENSLTSSSIAKALTENQQKRLSNPADCLNKNVKKGFCEKTKDGFFITPEGWQALGEDQ